MSKLKQKTHIREMVPAEDNENYMFHLVATDGSYEMGIYRVMYGWRVRAGEVDSSFCEVDYCAGADVSFLSLLYSMVKASIEIGYPPNELPAQTSKPFYTDPVHLGELAEIAGINDPEYKPVFLNEVELERRTNKAVSEIFGNKVII